MSARDKVLSERALVATVQSHKRAGRRIVFTNGAFDLLHVGHVRALEEAASLGGVLVVAVNSDESVRSAKGPGRPAVPAEERAEVVAGLACVDHVFVFPDATVDRLLDLLRPDVHAKGRDYTPETIPERETARRLGIEVAIVGDRKAHSSTSIYSRVLEAGVPQDRVVDVEIPDGKAQALEGARRTLAAHGWLDLARLVTGREGAVVTQRGDRFVRRVEVAGRPLFVKVAFPAERGRSALQEFQNHLLLRAAGFQAPEPWFAAEGRVDGRPASVLVTLEAPGLALHEYLALAHPPARPRERTAMARGIGSALRALHTARFLHPDLSASHLLVEGTSAVGRRGLTFLGLARVERAGRRLRRRQASEGLARLAFSLREVVPERFRLEVLRAYLGGSLDGARPWLEAIRARTARMEAAAARSGARARAGAPP